MTQVYNYLFGRNPRVAIQPVDLGKTSGVFFFFFFQKLQKNGNREKNTKWAENDKKSRGKGRKD